MIKNEKEITTMKVYRGTLQNIKAVASLQGENILEWLYSISKKALEAEIINRGRKHK